MLHWFFDAEHPLQSFVRVGAVTSAIAPVIAVALIILLEKA